jgi:hypothetical protein
MLRNSEPVFIGFGSTNPVHMFLGFRGAVLAKDVIWWRGLVEKGRGGRLVKPGQVLPHELQKLPTFSKLLAEDGPRREASLVVDE